MTVADMETLRGLAPALDWRGAPGRVERLRMVKDPSEVALVRAAIDVAERAFAAFRALLRPEDRETDLCNAMEHYVRQCGGSGTAFPPIVAVGERAALPHAPPTARAVGTGGLLLVDWGARAPLYRSDLTRVLDTRKTSTFSGTGRGGTGEAGPQLETIYAIVARAQQAAIDAVRPGVQAKEVDTSARKVIADSGYGEYFGHGLGHGVGLDIHEGPAVRPNSETPLEVGMVFTIEPGIYVPGWGGVRLEDDVLVTQDGCEILTRVPRELDALRAFA
jgi:Xaa-Pro aminopeptidase